MDTAGGWVQPPPPTPPAIRALGVTIENVVEVVKRGRLKWFGLVDRINGYRDVDSMCRWHYGTGGRGGRRRKKKREKEVGRVC